MAKQSCGKCESQAESASTLNSTHIKEIDASHVSAFYVSKMDCPSEERLIRLALEPLKPPVVLEFEIPNRQVKVFHSGNIEQITKKLEALGLGAKLEETSPITSDDLAQVLETAKDTEQEEFSILKKLLLINAFMFGLELIVGWFAQSTGLIADSLDMFSDAAVYGVALYAVGHSARMKLMAAHLSGWLQLVLALLALSEVLRRFLYSSEPISTLMMIFGSIALMANVYCLALISKNKDSGAHMKASWIFSANDVIANMGVILAGILVFWTQSPYPDLVIGFIIGCLVLNGAYRILQIKA